MIPRAILLASSVLCLAPSNARADVKTAVENGFSVRVAFEVDATPDVVYRYFVNDASKWWEDSHTFSGKAANLSIQAKAGGIFGEKLPGGGSVRHMSVLLVMPGKMIRMSGGLGPLQELAVNGVMTVRFTVKGEGTQVQLAYDVGGFVEGGLKKWAKPVDGVLTAQMKRLKAFVAKRSTSAK